MSLWFCNHCRELHGPEKWNICPKCGFGLRHATVAASSQETGQPRSGFRVDRIMSNPTDNKRDTSSSSLNAPTPPLPSSPAPEALTHLIAQSWQPIDTAPKDGTMVLLYPSSQWVEGTQGDYAVGYFDPAVVGKRDPRR